MITTVLLGIIGGPELAIIVLALLLLFGGKKIPELMKGLGQGVRAFKEGQTDDIQEKPTKEEEKEELLRH